LANRSIAFCNPKKYDNLFCQCYNCGFIWIATHHIECPFCSSKNWFGIPFREHKHFSFTWLDKNGFIYISKLLGEEF